MPFCLEILQEFSSSIELELISNTYIFLGCLFSVFQVEIIMMISKKELSIYSND